MLRAGEIRGGMTDGAEGRTDRNREKPTETKMQLTQPSLTLKQIWLHCTTNFRGWKGSLLLIVLGLYLERGEA